MCSNVDCPSKSLCHRHSESGTKPFIYQSFADFKPDKSGKCDNFWSQKEYLNPVFNKDFNMGQIELIKALLRNK